MINHDGISSVKYGFAGTIQFSRDGRGGNGKDGKDFCGDDTICSRFADTDESIDGLLSANESDGD